MKWTITRFLLRVKVRMDFKLWATLKFIYSEVKIFLSKSILQQIDEYQQVH